jgi:hypothetical protein
MILAVSSTSLLCVIISCLRSEFAVKDMGTLGFFLGVDIGVPRLASSFPRKNMLRISSSAPVWEIPRLHLLQLTWPTNYLLMSVCQSPIFRSITVSPAACSI